MTLVDTPTRVGPGWFAPKLGLLTEGGFGVRFRPVGPPSHVTVLPRVPKPELFDWQANGDV